MANEYLQRTPTSTGNRRVFTWSVWVKRNSLTSTNQNLLCSTEPGLISKLFFNTNDKLDYQNNSPSFELITSQTFRDVGNWIHILFVAETTASISSERIRLYVNGARITKFDTETYPAINSTLIFNYPIGHFISKETSATNWFIGEFADVFFIDGQALTPDVFGFYKQGKGYISAGSTQATDFRPGQWVPKKPRVITTEINRRGGFGVNGFYLPMNDSNNFGADFHCTPNSIIKLQENLPQPRCRIDGVGDYSGSLRDDPFKQYLVLALPFVSGGLSSGFGDYSAVIKGSGSAKTITNNTAVSIANTHGYYGSAAQFNGSHYLSIPTNTDFDFGTGDFTIEYWANYQTLSPALSDTIMGGTSTGCFGVYMSTSQWGFVSQNQAALQLSSGTIVGTNQFNHFAVVRKGNTLTGYLNGVAGAASTTWTYNMTNTGLGIGAQNNGNNKITGYLQDLRIYKGVAKYTGGFDVPRPYTPVGIATWRAVPDTTANNFATMNPLIGAVPRSGGTVTSTIVTYTDGNLTTRNSANAGYAPAMQSHSNVGMTTGKWYWEASNFSTTGNEYFGISKGNEIVTPNGVGTGIECLIAYLSSDGDLYLSPQYDSTARVSATLNNSPGTGISSTSDVIGFAFDVTNSSLSVYRNGVLNNTATGIAATSNVREWFVTKAANSSGSPSGMSWNFGQNPTFSGNTTAGTFTDSNGKGLFKYQPPSGFLSLCEDNLPTPAISDPGKYFKTVLWTGDGNNGRSIVGVGFTPDLVWIKSRNATLYHLLTNSVTGVDNTLSTNTTDAESFSTERVLNSFDSDGFSLNADDGSGYYGWNVSGQNYVAWCWRAGAGTTSTNTNGSITSVVSVNQDAGFSIVSYTGSGANSTVGHGLGKAPAMYITKGRGGPAGATNWDVYHKALGPSQYLQLNSTNAAGTSTTLWQNTNPTSSVFYLSSTSGDTNGSGSTYIAYCWAEIEGFSKFGSYSANFSADGPFVYCGFRPAFLIIKRTDSAGSWVLKDSSRNSTNPVDLSILAQASDTEYSSNSPIDFLSNGFKLRSTSLNDSGATFIFAAFAESPFQTANSK